VVHSLYETSEAGFPVVASLLRAGLVAGTGTASRVFFFSGSSVASKNNLVSKTGDCE